MAATLFIYSNIGEQLQHRLSEEDDPLSKNKYADLSANACGKAISSIETVK